MTAPQYVVVSLLHDGERASGPFMPLCFFHYFFFFAGLTSASRRLHHVVRDVDLGTGIEELVEHQIELLGLGDLLDDASCASLQQEHLLVASLIELVAGLAAAARNVAASISASSLRSVTRSLSLMSEAPFSKRSRCCLKRLVSASISS